MHQTGGVRPDRLQRREYPCVSLSGAQRGERLLDGPAREFVAERHRVLVHGEHSPLLRGQGVLDPARAQHVQQGRLGAGRDDGEQLQQRPGRLGQRRQPGQHGLAHRRGDPFVLGREQLGDVERVAARRGVHPQPPAGITRQPRHRLRRQRTQLDAHGHGGVQAAEHPLQRHGGGGLVLPVGQHQQDGQAVHPPGQERQGVQRGLVGPVDVLDDDDGLAVQLVEQGGVDRGDVAAGQRVGQRGTAAAGDVVHRTQRSGRGQVVTRPDQGGNGPVQPVEEGAHQAGLAQTRAAADERHPPRPGPRRGECGGEAVQWGLPLQELHGQTVGFGQVGRQGRTVQ